MVLKNLSFSVFSFFQIDENLYYVVDNSSINYALKFRYFRNYRIADATAS